MGDLRAHGSVAKHVMNIVRAFGPKDHDNRPRQNVMFFELGNWLTDVSQFRDPPAHVGSKLTIWRKGLMEHGPWVLRNIANLDQYAEELLGKPNQHGALACFLRHIAYVIGSLQFREKNPAITPKEFDWVFDKLQNDKHYKGYTQYWPHEHFDFPLYNFGDVVGAMQRTDTSLIARHVCESSRRAQAKTWTGASSKETCWIELKVVDDLTGNPIEGVELMVKMPDGMRRPFQTDSAGIVDIANLTHGNCEISGDIGGITLDSALAFVAKEEPGTSAWPPHPGERKVPAGCRILSIIARTVHDGESLEKIAQEYNSLNWKDLAYFNFGTTNPAEVNTKLREKVGCRRMTDDRANYRFSSYDKPGVIFVPLPWTLMASVDRKHVIRIRRLEFPRPRSPREDPPKSAMGGVPIRGGSATGTSASTPKVSSGVPPPGKRKMLKYLEDYIEFCAELLTVVEYQWRQLAAKPDTPDNSRELNKILALFGHICHIVEDFFFHSNFIDNAWFRLKVPLPAGEDGNRHSRIFRRRIRAPKGTHRDSKLSTTESKESNHIFSGFFGSKDINFTIRGGLDAMAARKTVNGFPSPLRVLLDPEARKQMRNDPNNRDDPKAQELDPDKMEKWLEKVHLMCDIVQKGRLKSDKVPKFVALAAGDPASKAFRKACEIETRLWDKYTWIPEDSRGVFATLMQMLNQADVEVEKSEKRSKQLDGNTNMGVTVYPTDNGAANEIIGSHALMNKDNTHKGPLYRQAFNVAVCVSSYITVIMVRQLARQQKASAKFNLKAKSQSKYGAVNTLRKPKYVDWFHLLQHFICHPDECEHRWHVEAMHDYNAPHHHVIKYIDERTVKKRMELAKEVDLKNWYMDIARQAQKEWDNVRKQ